MLDVGRGFRFIYFQFTELKVFERVNTCTLGFRVKSLKETVVIDDTSDHNASHPDERQAPCGMTVDVKT